MYGDKDTFRLAFALAGKDSDFKLVSGTNACMHVIPHHFFQAELRHLSVRSATLPLVCISLLYLSLILVQQPQTPIHCSLATFVTYEREVLNLSCVLLTLFDLLAHL